MRKANKLTPQAVIANPPGFWSDGQSLYMRVTKAGTAQFVYRWTKDGKDIDRGLGGVTARRLGTQAERLHRAKLELQRVREIARDMSLERLLGRDPRESRTARAKPATVRRVTFGEAVARYIQTNRSAWSNQKYLWAWEHLASGHAAPIADTDVATIGTPAIIALLEPIWRDKPYSGERVRGKIAAVLDFAKAQGWRSGENPAAFKGNLQAVFPHAAKAAPTVNHPELPYREANQFWRALREVDGIEALALKFATLSTFRTNEVLGMKWKEFDAEAATWTVPAERHKLRKPFTQPLSGAALDVLKEAAKFRRSNDGDSFVFPSNRTGKALGSMAMLTVLQKKLGYTGLTVHGTTRATFATWARECTDNRDIAEACLSHTIGNLVERSYVRTTLMDKRRDLLEQWAAHVATMPRETLAIA